MTKEIYFYEESNDESTNNPLQYFANWDEERAERWLKKVDHLCSKGMTSDVAELMRRMCWARPEIVDMWNGDLPENPPR